MMIHPSGGVDDYKFSEEISIVKRKKIFFKDLWPSVEEKKTMNKCLKSLLFLNLIMQIFLMVVELEEIKSRQISNF